MPGDEFLLASYRHRADFFEKERELFAELAKGQAPQSLFIGCSDSRVVPEVIMGVKPGRVFVTRVIGNIIPPYGSGEHAVGAVLEYAITHLRVPHLIVCGHMDCGAIHALDGGLDPEKEPLISRWLDYAEPIIARVEALGVSPEERHRALVEANVLLQLAHVQEYPVVRAALEANDMELHGWVYEIETHRVRYYDAETNEFKYPDVGALSGES